MHVKLIEMAVDENFERFAAQVAEFNGYILPELSDKPGIILACFRVMVGFKQKQDLKDFVAYRKWHGKSSH